MATKRFDKELHDTYDKFGRDVVKDYVSSFWGMEARDNPDRYGIDLHLYKDDLLIGYAEVEVRLSWKTVEFPYEDLNVPNRKKKLESLHNLSTKLLLIMQSRITSIYLLQVLRISRDL